MAQRIHDIPEEDRPRERLLRLGPASLSDAELLGLFINTGMKGENAVQIGQRVLSQCGSLRDLSRRSTTELAKHKGLGPAKAAVLAAAFELGRRSARESKRNEPLNEPSLIFEYLGLEMQALNHEEVHVLLLNTKLELTHHERLYKGSLNESVAHPRDILRCVMQHAAYAFVLVHNHPSGDPTPSDADRSFTRNLIDAADLMRIPLIDHLIVGHPSPQRALPYFSFRHAGLIK
jgi:DNA repair protein RadC